MKVSVKQRDGLSVVKIEGDLQIAGVGDAKPELVAILAMNTAIQLDLGDIGVCDTAGIQFLLMLRASALAKGLDVSTIAQSASFRAAIQRIGLGAECFEIRGEGR